MNIRQARKVSDNHLHEYPVATLERALHALKRAERRIRRRRTRRLLDALQRVATSRSRGER